MYLKPFWMLSLPSKKTFKSPTKMNGSAALKNEILNACDEDTKSFGSKESILVTKSQEDSLKPIRMRLEQVQNKEAYDEPMRILIGEDITRPTGKGMTLWN